jgi:DNA-binding transcriptional LysR family regulator
MARSLASARQRDYLSKHLSTIRQMHINDLDLNLLRIFDAVYRQRGVSRAAEALGVSQPAVSQGLTRLRVVLKDALFTRAGRGVAPTAAADALARAVQPALGLLGEALHAADRFDAVRSRRCFRLHMTDIGESEFLPRLMQAVRAQAPEVRIETRQLEYSQVGNALDTGAIDAAFGYLPPGVPTRRQHLFMERYVVLARADHPLLGARPSMRLLAELDWVVVRQHAETLRLLEGLLLADRIRLSTPHFMVIPAIVAATDLAVLLPRRIAAKFGQGGRVRFAQPRWQVPDFSVELHWSARAEADAGNRWLRELATGLFGEAETRAPKRAAVRRIPGGRRPTSAGG